MSEGLDHRVIEHNVTRMTSWVGYAMRFKSYEFRIREWVCVSTEKWLPRDLFSRTRSYWKRVFSPLLLIRFLLLLSSVPMLEAVVCKSHTVQSAHARLRKWARGRCWMSNWTRKRINSLSSSSKCLKWNFFTSRFWKWELNVVRSYNCCFQQQERLFIAAAY